MPERLYVRPLPDDYCIGSTEKAACTSITQSLTRCPKFTAEQVRARGLRTRLYLRHPITRFASCWAYFTPANNFPGDPVLSNRAYTTLRENPSIEQFTDVVLAGAENEHWLPQLAQHSPIDELFRLERIHDTWPKQFPLRYENRGRLQKPEISYRLAELEHYYAEDLKAWNKLD